jgi:hypothetical protein
VEKKFVCKLDECKGQCCVDGDSGAPLTDEELKIIDRVYDKILPYLRKESIQTIEKVGKHVIDFDNDYVTPLVNNKECAYAIFEEGIAKCAFEKAYEEGVIQFKKPVSCHLYPIRISKLRQHDGINYDTWHICEPARRLGDSTNTPIYRFLEEPLIRKYGKEWYNDLKVIAKVLEKEEKEAKG